MKYRVDLYYAGTITQYIEENSAQRAYEEALDKVENMSNEEFMNKLQPQPDGHDIYEEGDYLC